MLDDLGNIGEFLAAVGVIAWLVYVGFQVRQNSKWLRVNSVQAHYGTTEVLTNLLFQPGVTDLYLRGMQDYSDSSPEDEVNFSQLMVLIFSSAEISYLQEREGLGMQRSEPMRLIIRHHLRQPGVRRWWDRTSRGALGADFIEYVESEFLEWQRILPRRRRGGRRHKRVRIYDTQALMELFGTDDEEEVRRELARRGVTPHERGREKEKATFRAETSTSAN